MTVLTANNKKVVHPKCTLFGGGSFNNWNSISSTGNWITPAPPIRTIQEATYCKTFICYSSPRTRYEVVKKTSGANWWINARWIINKTTGNFDCFKSEYYSCLRKGMWGNQPIIVFLNYQIYMFDQFCCPICYGDDIIS